MKTAPQGKLEWEVVRFMPLGRASGANRVSAEKKTRLRISWPDFHRSAVFGAGGVIMGTTNRIKSTFIILAFVVGCGETAATLTAPAANPAAQKRELEAGPDWIHEDCQRYLAQPGLCGVGVVAGIRNPALARETASERVSSVRMVGCRPTKLWASETGTLYALTTVESGGLAANLQRHKGLAPSIRDEVVRRAEKLYDEFKPLPRQ